MLKDNTWSNRFMGSTDCYEKASTIMVGIPMDFTVSNRPGTRYGPQKMRECSYGLEEYSPYLNRTLQDKSFFDYGDIELPFGDIINSHRIIGESATEIFSDHKKAIFLGGEHSMSGSIIYSAFKEYGNDLVILHFDAHADLRTDYCGVKESHACVIRRVAEFVNPKNIFQFGIRSGTQEEFEYGRNYTNFFPFHVLEPVLSILSEIHKKPVYITLDIDVFDPAYACGTGTPEPGGCNPSDVFKVIQALKDFNVVGFDIVEVSPLYDSSDRTAILGAKLAREGLLSFL